MGKTDSVVLFKGNYYGTPKPPAEPNLVQPDLVDQVLFEEEFGTEVQRKRTTSVSKMDRNDSVVPEEEDDEERPTLPNGLPGVCVCVSVYLVVNHSLNRATILTWTIFMLLRYNYKQMLNVSILIYTLMTLILINGLPQQ